LPFPWGRRTNMGTKKASARFTIRTRKLTSSPPPKLTSPSKSPGVCMRGFFLMGCRRDGDPRFY
jgi:hypothetical protein